MFSVFVFPHHLPLSSIRCVCCLDRNFTPGSRRARYLLLSLNFSLFLSIIRLPLRSRGFLLVFYKTSFPSGRLPSLHALLQASTPALRRVVRLFFFSFFSACVGRLLFCRRMPTGGELPLSPFLALSSLCSSSLFFLPSLFSLFFSSAAVAARRLLRVCTSRREEKKKTGDGERPPNQKRPRKKKKGK